MINNKHKHAIKDYEQISGRNMTMTFKTKTNPLHIVSTYAPQSMVGKDKKEREKIKAREDRHDSSAALKLRSQRIHMLKREVGSCRNRRTLASQIR